jgi:hypothetical protein
MRSRSRLFAHLSALAVLSWLIAVPLNVADAQTPKRGGILRVAYGNEKDCTDAVLLEHLGV